MKSKFLIYLILFSIIGFVILSIFTSGEKHIVVVEENVVLTNENKTLKTENSNLKTLNSNLLAENNKLKTEQTVLLASANELKVKIEEKKLSVIPKIIVKIEKDIYSNLGWTEPSAALELLTEKLQRKPTKQEYEEALTDLMERDLLYYPGNPDPYVKGEKYSKKAVNKILNDYK